MNVKAKLLRRRAIIATILIGSAFSIPFSSAEQGEDSQPDPLNIGLIAHYSFDGEDPGRDVTGNGWDGIASGLELVPGIVGNAAAFDGTAGMIVDAFQNMAWGEELTVSLWFKRDASGEGGYQTLLNNGYDSETSWSLTTSPQGGGIAVWGLIETEPFERKANFVPASAAFNVWHHVALIYNRGRSYIFVDGVPQLALRENSGPIRVMDQPLFIACLKFQKNWRRSTVTLDEIRIYNRALSANEVNMLGADTVAASTLPAGERATVRRIPSAMIPQGSGAPAGRMPSQPPSASSEAISPSAATVPVTPQRAGVTASTAPRQSPAGASQSKPEPSVWWTDTQESGVKSTDDCCVILDTWKELWRTGQKQAVIDDLNKLTAP